MMPLRQIFVAALLLIPFAAHAEAQQGAEDGSAAVRSERASVTVIGASLSRGMQLGAEAEKRGAAWLFSKLPETRKTSIGLGALYAACANEPVRDRSDLFLFTSPLRRAEVQVDGAIGDQPRLILALDFLFWFGYWPDVEKLPKDEGSALLQGYGESDRELEKCLRSLEKQAQGFALVDRLLAETSAPIVLGDYPDMHGAHPLILHPKHIPLRRTLDELNRRLRAFAAERPRVLLFSLADYVGRAKRGEVALPGGSGRRVSPEAALQGDQLHPTCLGTALVMHEMLAELAPKLRAVDGLHWPGAIDFAVLAERAGAARDYRALLEMPPELAVPAVAK